MFLADPAGINGSTLGSSRSRYSLPHWVYNRDIEISHYHIVEALCHISGEESCAPSNLTPAFHFRAIKQRPRLDLRLRSLPTLCTALSFPLSENLNFKAALGRCSGCWTGRHYYMLTGMGPPDKYYCRYISISWHLVGYPAHDASRPFHLSPEKHQIISYQQHERYVSHCWTCVPWLKGLSTDVLQQTCWLVLITDPRLPLLEEESS